jgi:TolB-like protein
MSSLRFAMLAGAAILVGCNGVPTSGYSEPPVILGCAGVPVSVDRTVLKTQPIAALTYDAVDRLVSAAPSGLSSDTTFLVASVADIDHLAETGGLGRLISEEAATRLIQLGCRVPEVRLADTMHVREGGEFMLSRNLAELRRVHNADFVVTGTYSSVGTATHINLRLVRLADGNAISATEFEIPRSLALPNEMFSATKP